MTKQMIAGCGIQVEDKPGGMCCGDSIDLGEYDYITGQEFVQPIYCNDCWDKVKSMDLVGALGTDETEELLSNPNKPSNDKQ